MVLAQEQGRPLGRRRSLALHCGESGLGRVGVEFDLGYSLSSPEMMISVERETEYRSEKNRVRKNRGMDVVAVGGRCIYSGGKSWNWRLYGRLRPLILDRRCLVDNEVDGPDGIFGDS